MNQAAFAGEKLDSRKGVWENTGGEEAAAAAEHKKTGAGNAKTDADAPASEPQEMADSTGNIETQRSPTVPASIAPGMVPRQAIEETYSYQTYPF